MRLKIFRLIIFGLFVVVVLNLFWIQVIRGQYYFYLSKHNRVRAIPLDGWRGQIRDVRNVLLADNRVAYDVTVMPQDMKDSAALFEFLSQALHQPKARLLKTFQQKKLTPFTPVVIAADITRARAIVLEENKYRFPSLTVRQTFRRVYPLKENSAHLLGYVGRISSAERDKLKEYGFVPPSIIGKTGVEKYYDHWLKGKSGGRQIEVDSRGRQVRLLSMREASAGQDIRLTIDSRLQAIARDVLAQERGVVVVLDMANGEVLGLTSSPDYDPNLFVGAERPRSLSALFNDAQAPLLNRVISGLFPPGSVFKAVGAVAALDQQKITEHTSFLCKGFYELGGNQFRCAHIHGPQGLVPSLAHSCNVYYYHLGLIVGAARLNQYAQLFGLGQLTQIDLPDEKGGYLSGPGQRGASGKRQRWYTGNTLNFSIGQGDLLVTPLQLVHMMSIIAQEGRVVPPHLLKAVDGVEVQAKASRQLPIDASVFRVVKAGLRAAVADYSGTAHVLDLPEIYVAGKTGTAQSSGDQEDHSWFVGYAHGTHRRIAFAVFLEHGGSSQNACLLARRILLRMRQGDML